MKSTRTRRTSAKIWWIEVVNQSSRIHSFWKTRMDVNWQKKQPLKYMLCKARLMVTFIIVSDMNSKCSGLWEYAQKVVKMSNFVLCRHFIYIFFNWKCSIRFGAAVNWLVISVYYLAINTQRQWDGMMRRPQKVFIGRYPQSVGKCQKVTAENVSDNCYAFICGVTGALILSNVELCREMNGGIGRD